MEVLVFAFVLGPLLWIVLAVWAVARQTTSSRLKFGYFLGLCLVQILMVLMPFVIFELSANAVGLSDFEGCPSGQEYCDDFYQWEALQDRKLFHLEIVFWIGNVLWYSVLLFRSRSPSNTIS